MKRVDKHGYLQLSDPARMQLRYKKDQLRLACCRCQLTHDISFRVKGDILFIRFNRRKDREA